jgi:hypothetical protein
VTAHERYCITRVRAVSLSLTMPHRASRTNSKLHAFSFQASSSTPSSQSTQQMQSVHSSQLTQMKPKTCLLQQKNYKHARIGPTRYLRTLVEAMDATPLPNPTTETGVEREIVVPSPSCKNQRHQRQVTAVQNKTHSTKSRNIKITVLKCHLA